MDKPIDGDKYVRTLAHYLRHNQKRLIPLELDLHGNAVHKGSSSTKGIQNNKHVSSPVTQGVRSLITPADPMAAAYSGMVNSLWSVGSAVVNTVAPSNDHRRPQTLAQDRDSFQGAWDGTGTVPADSNPRERQLYLQAQLKAPIFPLDLYYLLYLLDRFELEGIEIEGWDGSTPRAVGDSKPRVLNSTASGTNGNNNSTYSSFPPPNATRPQSIRSFSSTALSTLTLITGWKQWSNAASSKASTLTIADDVHFIHKFLKQIVGLRLVAKIPPGLDTPGKGRIEHYRGDGILYLLNNGQSHELSSGSSKQLQQPMLPLAATFSALTHLELHKIPPRSVQGWESLMPQLKSLVVIQASIEDVHDVIVTAVVESERRRRQRVSREQNRAVLIRQEQREALKDASMATKARRLGSGSAGSGSSSAESSQPTSPLSPSLIAGADATSEDEDAILKSLNMWPVLRHLSVSDNALPALQNNDTFSHSQAIVTLDLSHNLLISPPPGLIHLHNLHDLNLSYNMLSSVHTIYQILGNIAVLDLRGNRLESLCGLERLWNLEKVDVRENHLKEAAEIGRLAALPGIREIWADMNPFCETQPKYRLEILMVFRANGHDLLLDGTFASFVEKSTLAKMSPSAFSTTLASINVVNLANIPAASAPTATFAKELAPPPPRITRPAGFSSSSSPNTTSTHHQDDDIRTGSIGTVGRGNENGLAATTSPGANSGQPQKLVKKKLVKSARRVKRVVNLDSDHEDDEDHNEDGVSDYGDDSSNHNDVAYSKVLGSPAAIGKKNSKKKTTSTTANHAEEADPEKKPKKKVVKKKNQGIVSFAGDHNRTNGYHNDGSDAKKCRDTRHVHRLAELERSMSSLQVQTDHSHRSHHQHQSGTTPSRGILKKPSLSHGHGHGHHHEFGDQKLPSPAGSNCSSSDEGGAEAYRRKIEAMRNEAGSNWLKVLAEMDSEEQQARRNSGLGQ